MRPGGIRCFRASKVTFQDGVPCNAFYAIEIQLPQFRICTAFIALYRIEYAAGAPAGFKINPVRESAHLVCSDQFSFRSSHHSSLIRPSAIVRPSQGFRYLT